MGETGGYDYIIRADEIRSPMLPQDGVTIQVAQLTGDGGLDSRLRGNDGEVRE